MQDESGVTTNPEHHCSSLKDEIKQSVQANHLITPYLIVRGKIKACKAL